MWDPRICSAWRFVEQILHIVWLVYKKVKCTLVQALRLCICRTAHRVNRGIALLFLNHGTRRKWRVRVTHRPLCSLRKDAVPIAQEAGWAPGPVWTGADNLASNRIRSPDHPARNKSLYRLRYPTHDDIYRIYKIMAAARLIIYRPCGLDVSHCSGWVKFLGAKLHIILQG